MEALAKLKIGTTETNRAVIEKSEDQKKVNQYVFLKKLGQGSYGKVKLVVDENTQQQYAMKIINKKMLSRKRLPGGVSALDDVKREVAIMKKLDHPNVVHLYEVIDSPDHPKLYMAMELLSGGSVEIPVAPERVRGFMRDVISGLEYLHHQHIIHRDLKPDNLLLSADGHIKISDFGVSFLFSGDDDATQKLRGTPGFLAPEVVEGAGSFSGRPVDIWALGITLFAFVFGDVPFKGPNPLLTYQAILTRELSFPHPVEPLLEDLIRGMLRRNPHERLTLDQVKGHPWMTDSGQDLLQTSLGEVIQPTDQEVAAAISPILQWHQVVRLRSLMGARLKKAKAALTQRPVAEQQHPIASAEDESAPAAPSSSVAPSIYSATTSHASSVTSDFASLPPERATL
ncbi:putative Calcium/calmodulin-dependent protein kinase kinase 2 [Paratrimastix pyriformis]|uniref:Calcium/calmodulin-dependent protein kinase kinase 2 n=1 Tax=Paratrimastix pyriformis TaxID=342808 RepID=A0ABQ8UUG0_9EUKA|nr:putative Calcium/calmodulin-dependent protein kinase kinase 2 [Paratrimastix pyriformis]|eukprot:GAFH01002219.1.p1 GENE.GAFH01002219.1~~GAFH01002219.1.p1  ORF type:complete len:414 (+),score=35.28 GAFH01002219.1:46-1242(+)